MTSSKRSIILKLIELSSGAQDHSFTDLVTNDGLLIEVARLHRQLSTGAQFTHVVMATWLGCSVKFYRDVLYGNVTRKGLVFISRLLLSGEDVTEVLSDWHGYRTEQKVGRPIEISMSVTGKCGHTIEKARVTAKIIGSVWARKLGMSMNTYLRRLSEDDFDETMVDLAQTIATEYIESTGEGTNFYDVEPVSDEELEAAIEQVHAIFSKESEVPEKAPPKIDDSVLETRESDELDLDEK